MKGYPNTINIEIVNDRAESAMFKQLFKKWSVKGQTVGLGKTYTVGNVGEYAQYELFACWAGMCAEWISFDIFSNDRDVLL